MMCMRFHDSIQFLVDIPDTLLEFPIPKLTFPPVIENSIIHGIMEKPEKSGTIVLTGWIDQQDIVILISDDGIGIESDKLNNLINEAHSSYHGSGNNIAVYNTHCRLQILYGTNYGLRYKSQLKKGTDVEIRIPIIYKTSTPE